MPATEKIPSYVRVQRVASILAEDPVLNAKLSGDTQQVKRRDGHSREFPLEAITVAQRVQSNGKDVAHIGRSEILKFARDFFKVEAVPKEPTKSISDRNSESVRMGVITLIENAIEFEQKLVGGSQASNESAMKRIKILERIKAGIPATEGRTTLLPAYAMVMSASTLADVDKSLSGLEEDFNVMRRLYQEVVVIQ